MRAKTNRLAVGVLALVGAVGGLILRRWQLNTAFDSDGLVVSGAVSTWVLGIFCALVTLLLALICCRLSRRSEYTASFSSGQPELVISLIAAALWLAGSGAALMAQPSGANLVVSFLGILSAFCVGATAVLRFRGTVPPVAIHAAPCIYAVVKLIVDFKQWSVDPAVLDYCYELFAAISLMCALYHLGGFCFDRGQRRLSVFWCLMCVVFSAVALASGSMTSRLLLGGTCCWAAVNSWQLLEE